jgi:hypothetical protein
MNCGDIIYQALFDIYDLLGLLNKSSIVAGAGFNPSLPSRPSALVTNLDKRSLGLNPAPKKKNQIPILGFVFDRE